MARIQIFIPKSAYGGGGPRVKELFLKKHSFLVFPLEMMMKMIMFLFLVMFAFVLFWITVFLYVISWLKVINCSQNAFLAEILKLSMLVKFDICGREEDC